MKHLYVPTPVNTFHKNDKWQFFVCHYCDKGYICISTETVGCYVVIAITVTTDTFAYPLRHTHFILPLPLL